MGMAVAGVLALLIAGDVVLLVALGALGAYLADPLVGMLEARGLDRTVASIVVFTGLVVLAGAALLLLVPLSIAQVKAVQASFDAEAAGALLRDLEQQVQHWLAGFGITIPDLLARVEAWATERLMHMTDYALGAVSFIVELVLVPFFAFFLLKDGPAIRRSIISAVPNRYFELALGVLHKMDAQLGGYLRGQFVEAVVVGVLSTFALWLLGVPYFVLIGVIAGAANIVPYVGPVVGTLLAVVASLLDGGGIAQAGAVVAAFFIIQQIDNLVVQPYVLSRNVALHPLLILLSVIVGGKLFGALGLLLAVPAIAILKVSVHETVMTLRRYRLAEPVVTR